MDKSITVNLLSQTYTQDTIGQYVPATAKRKVYAARRSVTRTEWFDAGRNGLKPEFSLVMRVEDYGNETEVEVDGKTYAIYRTYIAQGDDIELYCQAKGGI